jgi:hypothetical protein
MEAPPRFTSQSDGLNVGYNGGSLNMWMSNVAAAQETVVSTLAAWEAETGAVVVNVIPKDGGNTFKGTVFANYAGEGWALTTSRATEGSESASRSTRFRSMT